MYKLVLCFVLILSTTLYGCRCSHKLAVRKKSLRLICDGIVRVKTLITFGGYDICRVLQESFKDIKAFDEFETDSMFSDEKLFADSFFESLKKELSLESEDMEIIRNFTDALGVTDTEGQISNCNLYFELMNKQLLSAEDKEKSSGRLYKILGFSLGLVITLMIV